MASRLLSPELEVSGCGWRSFAASAPDQLIFIDSTVNQVGDQRAAGENMRSSSVEYDQGGSKTGPRNMSMTPKHASNSKDWLKERISRVTESHGQSQRSDLILIKML